MGGAGPLELLPPRGFLKATARGGGTGLSRVTWGFHSEWLGRTREHERGVQRGSRTKGKNGVPVDVDGPESLL